MPWNALEGNTLTLSETKILLEDGLTVAGKPMKDCYEAIGYGEAYDKACQKRDASNYRDCNKETSFFILQ
jgi:Fic family protein